MSLQSSFRKRWLGKHDTPRSPHKEHGPKGHQGAGQARARGRIHAGLGGIFTGDNEGAGILDQPPKRGFNVSIAGDRQSINRLFRNIADVDGVWEGEKEQSYLAHAPKEADAGSVLRRAARAGKDNDQDAVFVRFDGKKRPGRDWRPGSVHSLVTPHGIVDMVNASTENIRAATLLARKHGQAKLVQHNVWTRLLERGKDY